MNGNEIMKLTQKLGLTALAIGLVIIGKRYFENWRLHSWAVNTANEIKYQFNNCFIIDRLIDAECIDGKPLVIGVNGKIDPNNILSNQGIRLGQNGDIKELVSFERIDDGLIYNFKDNTNLSFTKNKTNNKIMYVFQMPGKIIVKEMNDNIIDMYRSIGMSSSELDKIVDLKDLRKAEALK